MTDCEEMTPFQLCYIQRQQLGSVGGVTGVSLIDAEESGFYYVLVTLRHIFMWKDTNVGKREGGLFFIKDPKLVPGAQSQTVRGDEVRQQKLPPA